MTAKERELRKQSSLHNRIHEVEQEIKSLKKVPKQNKVNMERIEYWQIKLKELQRNMCFLELSVKVTK